jgi:hypothetical protein
MDAPANSFGHPHITRASHPLTHFRLVAGFFNRRQAPLGSPAPPLSGVRSGRLIPLRQKGHGSFRATSELRRSRFSLGRFLTTWSVTAWRAGLQGEPRRRH